MFRVGGPQVPAATLSDAAIAALLYNGSCRRRFAAHHAELLVEYMKEYYAPHLEAVRGRFAPAVGRQEADRVATGPEVVLLGGAASRSSGVADSAKLGLSKLCPHTNQQYFVTADFAQRAIDAERRVDAPSGCVLPLPRLPYRGLADGADDAREPRVLHHVSAFAGFEAYDAGNHSRRFESYLAGNGVASASATKATRVKATKAKRAAADTTSAAPKRRGRKPSKESEALTAPVQRTLLEPVAYHTERCPMLVPRCGLTGMFFQREEVTDNLIAANQLWGYGNPFWLRDTHPQLHKFLKLAPGSSSGDGGGVISVGGGTCYGHTESPFPPPPENLFVSHTAVVYFLEDVQAAIPVEFVHPSLHADVSSTTVAGASKRQVGLNVANVIPGTNAITGHVSQAAYFSLDGSRGQASHGVWVSLDQMRRLGLKLKDGAVPRLVLPNGYFLNQSRSASASTGDGVRWSGGGELVEVDEWKLYNASQLAVPGRLALKQASVVDGGSDAAAVLEGALFR